MYMFPPYTHTFFVLQVKRTIVRHSRQKDKSYVVAFSEVERTIVRHFRKKDKLYVVASATIERTIER